jgi:hypothetical protein
MDERSEADEFSLSQHTKRKKNISLAIRKIQNPTSLVMRDANKRR